MQAREFLQERTLENGSKLLATYGSTWVWSVPTQLYINFYNKNKNSKYNTPRPLPAANSPVWWVGSLNTWSKGHREENLPSEDSSSDYTMAFYSVDSNKHLIHLAGTLALSAMVLRKLAKESGAIHSPGIDPNYLENVVLYQGKVQKTKDMSKAYDKGSLPDGSATRAVPRDLYWTVGGFEYPDTNRPDWDTIWTINQPVAGTIHVFVKNNKIVSVGYIASSKVAQTVKAIQQLANREGLELAVKLPEVPEPKKKTVKPNSVMHKMLAYIAEHPGANRSDWFVKHMGYSPQGMPGWTDHKAHDGIAAGMGWIRNESDAQSRYSLHITPLGNMVLARLNAGMPAPYTREV
jgi:hypothetical protein